MQQIMNADSIQLVQVKAVFDLDQPNGSALDLLMESTDERKNC